MNDLPSDQMRSISQKALFSYVCTYITIIAHINECCYIQIMIMKITEREAEETI